MSGINKAIILGRLTRDPEIKNVKGLDIANFSIATSKQWTNKEDGTKGEKAEFHNIVAFQKLAELAGKYLTKGRQVYLEGELQTRSWDDKESGAKKYRTEIIANRIEFVGDKPAENAQTSAPTMSDERDSTPDDNSEIPF